MDALIPWAGEGEEEVGMEERFEPLRPRYFFVEGSVLDKSRQLKQSLIKKVMVPAMRLGAEAASGVRALASSVVDRLESVEDIDEAYGPTLQELLLICRGVCSVVDGAYYGCCTQDAIDSLKKSAESKNAKSSSALIASTMLQVEYWKKKLVELEQYAVPNFEHGGTMKKTIEWLSSCGDNLEAPLLLKALDLMECTEGKVSPKYSDDLRAQLVLALERVQDLADKAMATEGGQLPIPLLELEAVSVRATEVLSGAGLQRFATAVTSLRKQQDGKEAMGKCARLCGAGTAELGNIGVLPETLLEELRPALRAIQGATPETVPGTMKVFVQEACMKLLETSDCIVQECHALNEVLGLCTGWMPTLSMGSRTVALADFNDFVRWIVDGIVSSLALETQVEAGCVEDAMMTNHLSLIMQSKKFMDGEDKLPEAAQGMMARFGMRMSIMSQKATVIHLKTQQHEIERLASGQLATLAGGGDEDTYLWTDSLAPNASFATLLNHTQETLEKAPGKVIKRLTDGLGDAVRRYLALRSMHGTELQPQAYPEWLARACDLHQQGRATIIQALLVHHMRNKHGNVIALKNAVKTQMAAAMQEEFGRSAHSLMHKTLLDAANKAKASQLVWPARLGTT